MRAEPQPVIRAAVPADAGPVAAIFAHYVATSVATFEEVAPTAADWRQRFGELAARNLPFLVAEAAAAGGGGSVCGFAYASPWRPKSAYRHTVEDTVYLTPGWTGRGIGTALLTELLRRCAETGVRQVIAVIADTGTPASAALHDYLGFAEVGKLPKVGCKHGRWIDTVLMQKDLTDGPGNQVREQGEQSEAPRL
jgi:L-amino acid N-acyltransferase YncA